MEKQIKISIFNCLDIIRNKYSIVGEKAYYEFLYFFVLKLIEPKIIKKEIIIPDSLFFEYDNDPENFEYNKSNILLSNLIKNFSNLPKRNELYMHLYYFLWNEILAKHEVLKLIFVSGKHSIIEDPITIIELCNAVDKIPINDNFDELGEVYEQIFTDSNFGAGKATKSAFGQFFTPFNIKQILIDLVNPTIINNQIESVLDPSCGSGGILKTVIKKYLNSSNCPENIKEQIVNSIYGIEIYTEVYKLGIINTFLTTGNFCNNIINSDSIRKFNNIKVDCIIANPPFSLQFKIDDICTEPFYIPIKTRHSEFLFIQMMIYSLKIGGRCATVLLDSKKLSSTKEKINIIREYLLRTCDVHEIINLPKGSFISTDAKTIIIYFTKRKNPEDVLKSNYQNLHNVKLFKNNKFKTKSVKFYSYDKTLTQKNFLKELSIYELYENNYSFAFHDYKEELQKIKGILYKPLIGTFCTFGVTSKLYASDGLDIGEYPFYTSSNELKKFTNNPIYDKESIIIGTGGSANINYDIKFSCTKTSFILHAKKNINLKYVYLYLKNNLHILQHYFTGSGLQSITKTDIEKIKIPWVSFENQNKTIELMEKEFNKIIEENKQDLLIIKSIKEKIKLRNENKMNPIYKFIQENQVSNFDN